MPPDADGGKLVRRLTGGHEPYRGLIPEEIVASGILQDGVLSGWLENVLLLDFSSASISVEVHGTRAGG